MKYIIILFIFVAIPFAFSEARIMDIEINHWALEEFGEIREERIAEALEKAKRAQERGGFIGDLREAEMNEKKERFMKMVEENLDEQLKNRAKRLSGNINMVNQNLSNRHMEFISALEVILDKIESRTAKIEVEKEKDLSSIYLEIYEIRNEIEFLRDEISYQKSKTYVVEISSIKDLSSDFRRTIQGMRRDHQFLTTLMQSKVKFLMEEITLKLRDI